jgi:hypothetical protein
MEKADRKVKREANFEFPPWDYVPYKDQTKDYFRTIKKQKWGFITNFCDYFCPR